MVLNCAVDANGHLAGPGGATALLSTPADLARVHGLRASLDAILVGVGTVLQDDPSLRVKTELATGPDPVRVVLDRRLRTPADARVVDGTAPTRIYHSEGTGPVGAAVCVRVPEGPGGVDLHAVLADLEAQGLDSVLVEGGAEVLRSFVKAGLWDTWTVFQTAAELENGPGLWGGLPERQPAGVRLVSKEHALGGTLWTFSP